MPRPRRCRKVFNIPEYNYFIPVGKDSAEFSNLTVDEYEMLRLVDWEKKTHEEASHLMDISRTTATEIYESAREKIADALVNGKAIRIEGGSYTLSPLPGLNISKLKDKGDRTMRIAVTHENGNVFQHFGHTEEMKVYDVEDGKIVRSEVVSTNGSGHGALAGFLKNLGVDTLICGGIGGGAQMALQSAGITFYGGVSGDADKAVEALLNGDLEYNPNVMCSHHDHHGEGHSCGSHGNGECHSTSCHH